MKSKIENLKNITAKNVDISDRVTFSILDGKKNFPFVVSANYPDINISGWMESNRALLDSKLKLNGAILFKGFKIYSVEKFQVFMTYFGQELLEYKLRSSPRHAVAEKVYVSTKYPSEYSINMHSESSYSPDPPKKIAFCCIEPPNEGGETPVADNRLVLNWISDKTKSKFDSLGVKYERFFSNGAGMSWQEAFQTNDKQTVENECSNMGINFKWENDIHLVLTWNKKAILGHPETGDAIWFNHALFFNKYAPGYEEVNLLLGQDRLPNNTYFGDGTEIAREEIQEIMEAYQKSTIQFKWERGDVLLLDNILMSHGRNPFKGNRNIIVSMV